MTNKETYFFDTYAILEIIKGSESYKPYVNVGLIITKLNLFELYYALFKVGDKERALHYLHQFKQFVVDFDTRDIESAAELKLNNKNLSMSDCIGYVTALGNNIRFLTGDKEFKNMPNVEFVK